MQSKHSLTKWDNGKFCTTCFNCYYSVTKCLRRMKTFRVFHKAVIRIESQVVYLEKYFSYKHIRWTTLHCIIHNKNIREKIITKNHSVHIYSSTVHLFGVILFSIIHNHDIYSQQKFPDETYVFLVRYVYHENFFRKTQVSRKWNNI